MLNIVLSVMSNTVLNRVLSLVVKIYLPCLLCCFATVTASAQSKMLTFAMSEVETGISVEQTILTARLYDQKHVNLVVLSVDDTDARKLSIYGLEGKNYNTAPLVSKELDPELILADQGELDGKEIIFFLARNRLLKLNPDTLALEPVLRFPSVYNTPAYKSLPRRNFVRDVNGDGSDDLLIPDFDGFWVFIQQENSSFKEGVKVGTSPAMETSYNNSLWYRPQRVFTGDHNLDGLQDLLFWNRDQFEIYYQGEGGVFGQKVGFYEPPVKLEQVVAQGMSFSPGEQDEEAAFIYKIVDLDGDGIIDLITLSLDSKGVFKKKTTYNIYKGYSSIEGVKFEDQPVTRIESPGVQFNMDEKDFDGDGQVDVVISAVEIGLGKIIAALITGSVSLDLEFYKMEDGVYPKAANTYRTIKAEFDLSSGEVFFPFVLTADVTGDQIDDLLVQHRRDKLKIYVGTGDDSLFEKSSHDIEIEMPSDPTLVRHVDMDGDGKQDMLMQFKPDKENSGRIKTLIFN